MPEDESTFVEFSPEWTLIEQENLLEITHPVAEALNQLPKRQWEVTYLRYYQNLN